MKSGCTSIDSVGSLVMPCAGGCGPRGPIVHRVLIDRISPNRTANGQVCSVDFDSAAVPHRDRSGRFPHCVGVSIEGTVDLETTAATNDAVTPYAALRKLSSLWLKDCTGHAYLNGTLDGRSVAGDDRWFRNLRLGPAELGGNGLDVDVGAAQANEVAVNWYIPFTPSSVQRPTLRGLILYDSLRAAGREALRFTVSELTGFTSVTDNGFIDSGLVRVWADIVYLDRPSIDSGWSLEGYTLEAANGRFYHADRMHEYIVNRPLPEDAATVDLTAITGVTIQTGEDMLTASLSADEMAYRDQLTIAADLVANGDAWSATNPQGLAWEVEASPTAQSEFTMYVPRSRTREGMPSGPAAYAFTSMTGNDQLRILHRTVLCPSEVRIQNTLRALGCAIDPSTPVQLIDESGKATHLGRDPGAMAIVDLR